MRTSYRRLPASYSPQVADVLNEALNDLASIMNLTTEAPLEVGRGHGSWTLRLAMRQQKEIAALRRQVQELHLHEHRRRGGDGGGEAPPAARRRVQELHQYYRRVHQSIVESSSVEPVVAKITGSTGAPSTFLNGSSDLTPSTTTVVVLNHIDFPGRNGFRIKVDNEIMEVTAGAGTAVWTVTRGVDGTPAVSHANGTTVTLAGAYSWVEQEADPDDQGKWRDLEDGRTGEADDEPAFERNRNTTIEEDTIVLLWRTFLDAGDVANSTLSAQIDSSTTTIPITLRDNFPGTGVFYIKIGEEILRVTAGHGTGPGNFTAERGKFDTEAASHSSGAEVRECVCEWVFDHCCRPLTLVVPVPARITAIEGGSASLLNNLTEGSTTVIISAAASVNFPARDRFRIRIEGEAIEVTDSIRVGSQVHSTVTRGVDNTSPLPHVAGNSVTHVGAYAWIEVDPDPVDNSKWVPGGLGRSGTALNQPAFERNHSVRVKNGSHVHLWKRFQPSFGMTLLTAPIDNVQTTIQVQSHSTFPQGPTGPEGKSDTFFIQIGLEVMRVIAGAGTNTWTVQRGQFGTIAEEHVIGGVTEVVVSWVFDASGSDEVIERVITANMSDADYRDPEKQDEPFLEHYHVDSNYLAHHDMEQPTSPTEFPPLQKAVRLVWQGMRVATAREGYFGDGGGPGTPGYNTQLDAGHFLRRQVIFTYIDPNPFLLGGADRHRGRIALELTDHTPPVGDPSWMIHDGFAKLKIIWTGMTMRGFHYDDDDVSASSEEVYELQFDEDDRFVVEKIALNETPPVPGDAFFVDLALPSQAIARSTFAQITRDDTAYITLMTMFINTSATPGRAGGGSSTITFHYHGSIKITGVQEDEIATIKFRVKIDGTVVTVEGNDSDPIAEIQYYGRLDTNDDPIEDMWPVAFGQAHWELNPLLYPPGEHEVTVEWKMENSPTGSGAEAHWNHLTILEEML